MNKFLFALLVAGIPSLAHGSEIVILDQGVNTTHGIKKPVQAQTCFSLRTILDTTDGDGTGTKDVRFHKLSLCNGGGRFQNHSRSSQVPRLKPNPPEADLVLARKLVHGNEVSSAARDFHDSPQVPHHMVQIFGLINYHYQDNPDGYWDDDGDTIARALQYFGVNTQGRNIGAINMSFARNRASADGRDLFTPSSCLRGTGQQLVYDLLAKNIAVVAGLANQDLFDKDQSSWPQCLDGVINVAGNAAPASKIGLGSHDLDFYAENTVTLKDSSNTTYTAQGNSFAAPRVATAFAMLHDAFPDATVVQKIQALNNAMTAEATKTFDGIDYKAKIVDKNKMATAINELGFIMTPPPQDPPPGQDGAIVFNFAAGGTGPMFGINQPNADLSFDFIHLLPIELRGNQPAAFIKGQHKAALVQELQPRDVVMTMRAGGSFNFDFRLNGGEEQRIGTFSTNSSIVERSIMLHRGLFVGGTNSLMIEPWNSLITTWGIESIKLELLPSISLIPNVNHATMVGSDLSNAPIQRPTGARFDVTLNQTQIDTLISRLEVQGWDMDAVDEMSVYINNNFLGLINQSPGSSRFSPANRFVIKPEYLLNGRNIIEFIQREPDEGWTGAQDEKWAIRNIKLTQTEPAEPFVVIPSIMILMMDDDTTPPAP